MCSNVAVGIDIAVSVGNYVIMSIYYAIRRNAAACIQSNVTIFSVEVSVCSDIIRCVDIYFVISFNVLRRYTALTGFELCFTSLCSNIADGIDITVSIRNYVVMSIYCALGCNAATACIQGNVTIFRDEISACSNILLCVDIYCLTSSYVLGIYAASAGVKNCFTVCCSNIAIGIDIAVSVGNYVIMSIYCAIRRNAAACKQIYVSISRSEATIGSDIIRCVNIYIVIGSYVTASCNRSLPRIDAYLISCIQSNSVCCSNIAICLNSDITGMLIIILRGIDIGVNSNLAGICLVVFNQDIALDMRIINSNQQIIRRTIKPGYAINQQAAVCALTLNRQALHLILLAEQLLRLAGFNCQIVCSNTCSRCILHYAAVSIQRQAVVSTVHCNAAVAKCDITISCGNYAISARCQRAAVQVNVVACSDVACASRGNAAGCYIYVSACSDIACAACSNSTCVQVNIVTVNSYISACANAAVTCVVTEVYITIQVELSISLSSNAVNYQACILRACALQVNGTVFCLSVNYSAVFQNTDTVISFADIAVGCLQVNAVSVQITGVLACFRSHLHTIICFEHQRSCCRILNGQHLRRLAAYSRLMQIYAVACIGICFQITADISLDEGILAAYIALAALDNKVIGNNAAVVHANALIAEQLNILRRINRTGNIQHSILNACQINITGIFSITSVGLKIQLAAICQLYRNLTLLTNFNSVVGIIPGKVTGLSLCQKLKIIQLAHLAVGNVSCFAVDTDVLACAQADVLALNVGLIYCKYLAGGCIQHAVLNSIQQLIFAPAIGSAVLNLCVVDNPLQLSIAIAFASKYTVFS